MSIDKEKRPPPLLNDEVTLAAGRSLQRKLTFWRRAAWSVLGLVLIFTIVLWNRAVTHRRNCAGALELYARLANSARLEREPEEILKAQWQDISRHANEKPRPFPPSHYLLIVDNWGRVPIAGESIPLAVCSSPHLVLFSYGRHVLYRDDKGLHVKWVDEDTVQPILVQANEGRPDH